MSITSERNRTPEYKYAMSYKPFVLFRRPIVQGR